MNSTANRSTSSIDRFRAPISGLDCETRRNTPVWIAEGSKEPMVVEPAARPEIVPQNEHLPMSRINEAFARLASDEARCRILLEADF